MERECLAPNEMMQLHELLNAKTIQMTSSKLMEGIVFDQDLKMLLEQSVKQSIHSIEELQSLYTRAPKIR
jgi:similar to spore coat protein